MGNKPVIEVKKIILLSKHVPKTFTSIVYLLCIIMFCANVVVHDAFLGQNIYYQNHTVQQRLIHYKHCKPFKDILNLSLSRLNPNSNKSKLPINPNSNSQRIDHERLTIGNAAFQSSGVVLLNHRFSPQDDMQIILQVCEMPCHHKVHRTQQ